MAQKIKELNCKYENICEKFDNWLLRIADVIL
jgi:hypothetical protein